MASKRDSKLDSVSKVPNAANKYILQNAAISSLKPGMILRDPSHGRALQCEPCHAIQLRMMNATIHLARHSRGPYS